ncbi:hypothetical protein TRFO_18387 [Tritrichomonas foetus]|uniref:EF-hand domain-containing protein n=1 Tax=Tritrichomonas foetus TaxID=1144522 RepID=A0A1J4KL17_9EUKA|nr:hypothetical protein TRFO_18387 [Tritrichomonas foetus]|eukprot:OHT11923.1 hypothetical protein TRFO_18387 [Tritrichomonas foetus]
MAYIHTYESALQAIEKFGTPEEKEEYLKLIGDRPSTSTNAILPFSYSVSNKATKYIPDLTKLVKKVLPDIISGKIITEDECNKYLQQIPLGKNKKARFIQYNQKHLQYVSQNAKSILFSEDVFKAFVFSRYFFDFLSFSQFVKGIIQLNKDFGELVSYSTMPGCFLTLDDVGDFIDSKIPKLSALKNLMSNDGVTLPFYRQLVLEQITFHFDPYGMNRISAIDLMTSNDFTSFLTLTDNDDSYNFYSYQYFIDIFAAFSKNVNEEGLMNRESFKECKDWKFCQAFVDRVFEKSSLFSDCLDFGGFAHFYVNYENSETPTGARYYFDLLDIDGDGLIGPFDIGYFFKDLLKESQSKDANLDIFIQELLDKTQATQMGFTLEQFISCGSCEEIASILSDYNEFKIYVGHDETV